MTEYHYRCKTCSCLTTVQLEDKTQIFDVEEHGKCPDCSSTSLVFYQPIEVDLVCKECKYEESQYLPKDEIADRLPHIPCGKCHKNTMRLRDSKGPGISTGYGSKTPNGMKEVFAKIKQKTGQNVKSRFD